ncbi:MAG: hypothetical protein ABSG65_09700 [Bryobacteraceae bacterium]|jgi:hypothetical protein
MTKHYNQSRLWTMAAALALVLGSALLLSGQESKTRRGLPKDWSMHHVVYSKPGANVSAARLQKLQKDPRYILQQELRAAMAAPPSLPAPLSALNDNGPADISPAKASGPLPRGLMKALIPATGKEAVPPPSPLTKRIHKDWSVGIGSNGTTGVGQFPATFTQTATPCATDYAVYNTGLGGSSSQATIVAYNNIYASCDSGIPTVFYAYNTGAATVATSVDLSLDGTQVAFIQGNSGSAASLVVVRTANSGGTVATPVTPTAVAPGSYNGCTAPCQTTVALSGSPSDTYSSPFYDYSSDTLYVGDDGGRIHKFTGVFLGTPAEAGSPWPASTLGVALGSPVYDASTGLVFIGDYLLNYASGCEPSATNSAGSCGYLYSVAASSATVVRSAQLDYQYGIVDSPIVDPTTGQVFAFVGADNTTACSSGPCAGVFQFPETFIAAATGTEVQVGAGYEFLLSGAFDNNYFTTGTGNLYVVGGTGPQNNTLYAIPVTSGSISSPATPGPAVAANYTGGYYAGGLQVTEFYTGTYDYVFAGALMINAANGPLIGLVSGYNVTAPPISPSTVPTGSIAAQGGPSGIVVDNSLATAQNIYYSTTLNASCTTSGTGGCAVQVIQAAP